MKMAAPKHRKLDASARPDSDRFQSRRSNTKRGNSGHRIESDVRFVATRALRSEASDRSARITSLVVDSLAAGHLAWLLRTRSGVLLAYCVAMPGVEEMHLLNLTVTPAAQGRGLARGLLDALVARCRHEQRGALWLEVRESNQRARRIYQDYGFEGVGLRRGYYPASDRREDAVVMRLRIDVKEDDGALD